MLYGMMDIGRNTLGLSSHSERLKPDEFWALDDVSFEVKRGETLGVIGPNGSGKTTLLKLINGIFWPDKGKITVRGRVGALIAVGAGFHPLLTGRENIYVNGAILGMSKREIDQKFDSIVEFADIGDFLDVPVKHYSSGMFVRLGFAVAVHTDPNILLVDEILSVGDIGFRIKSMKRIKSLIENGTSVIFVSHDVSTIVRICDRVMCLQTGENIFIGEPGKALEYYKSNTNHEALKERKEFLNYSEDCFISKIYLIDTNNKPTDTLKCGDCLKLEIYYATAKIIHKPHIIISINSTDYSIHTGASSFYDGYEVGDLYGSGKIILEFKELILGPGEYFMNLSLLESDNFTIIKQYLNICRISISSQQKIIGNIELKHNWQHTKIYEIN